MNIVCSLSRLERPEECQKPEQRLVRSTLGKEGDMCLQKVRCRNARSIWGRLTDADVLEFRGIKLCRFKCRLKEASVTVNIGPKTAYRP